MSQYTAYLLSFEYIFGGQCRITPLFTPTLYDRCINFKGPPTRDALYPLIPIKNHVLHTNFIGLLMLTEGLLLALPKTRGSLGTLALGTFLTGAGIYSQRKMGIPYWLPVVNMCLGVVVWGGENWEWVRRFWT